MNTSLTWPRIRRFYRLSLAWTHGACSVKPHDTSGRRPCSGSAEASELSSILALSSSADSRTARKGLAAFVTLWKSHASEHVCSESFKGKSVQPACAPNRSLSLIEHAAYRGGLGTAVYTELQENRGTCQQCGTSCTTHQRSQQFTGTHCIADPVTHLHKPADPQHKSLTSLVVAIACCAISHLSHDGLMYVQGRPTGCDLVRTAPVESMRTNMDAVTPKPIGQRAPGVICGARSSCAGSTSPQSLLELLFSE